MRQKGEQLAIGVPGVERGEGAGTSLHSTYAVSPGFSSVHKNMPLVAGGLRWVQDLRQRIQGPFTNFRSITHP